MEPKHYFFQLSLPSLNLQCIAVSNTQDPSVFMPCTVEYLTLRQFHQIFSITVNTYAVVYPCDKLATCPECFLPTAESMLGKAPAPPAALHRLSTTEDKQMCCTLYCTAHVLQEQPVAHGIC